MRYKRIELTICFVNPRAAGDGLDGVQHLLHQLRRLVEDNLIVELRHQALLRVDDWRLLDDRSVRVCNDWSVGWWRLEQLQDVIERDGSGRTQKILQKLFFVLNFSQILLVDRRIVEVNLDDHFELSPARLTNFIRRLCYDPVGTFVTFM